MAGVIRDFDYSKVKGRGKGVLGLKKFEGIKGLNKSSEGRMLSECLTMA